MSNVPEKDGNDFRKRLNSLHFWNALLVALLAVSGLVLFSKYWKAVLGDARAWIKWLHIIAGLASGILIFSNLRFIASLWKHLNGKFWQLLNVIAVLLLLSGWLISGVLLWQYHAAGPSVTNAALLVHDLTTWIGLPIIIYHSLNRIGHLQDVQRHQRKLAGKDGSHILEPEKLPLYSRKSFIYMVIVAGLAISVGPSINNWIKKLLFGQGIQPINEADANHLLPAPQPLEASSPPIGGGASGQFRVYTVTAIPSFNNHNWSFTIDGLVEKPVTWTWEQFVALQRSVQVSDFHCVTGWSVYHNTWEGIPLADLLEKARVKAQAKVVKMYSGDGVYTDSLTLEQAALKDVMVAVMRDGKPIPNELGGPVRLIVPKMYGYKSVKWLNRMELIGENYIGYWEQRGYENDAWIENK